MAHGLGYRVRIPGLLKGLVVLLGVGVVRSLGVQLHASSADATNPRGRRAEGVEVAEAHELWSVGTCVGRVAFIQMVRCRIVHPAIFGPYPMSTRRRLGATPSHEKCLGRGSSAASIDNLSGAPARRHAEGCTSARARGLHELPALVVKRSATVTRTEEIDLWSSPLVFGLLILLITIEWIVRKYSELK